MQKERERGEERERGGKIYKSQKYTRGGERNPKDCCGMLIRCVNIGSSKK